MQTSISTGILESQLLKNKQEEETKIKVKKSENKKAYDGWTEVKMS